MSKHLRIHLLSLLCLHAFVAADPWPGIPTISANHNVTVFSSGTMNGNNSVVITHKNSGASADFDFGFKHAAITGACVTVVAWIATTWSEPDVFPSGIKHFLRRICGLKKS
jgi:hypothetical protein